MISRLLFVVLAATTTAPIDRAIENLGSPDAAKRSSAATELAAAGTKAVPALVDALNDNHRNHEAQLVLLEIGPPAIPALIDCFRAPQGSLEWWSCPSVLVAMGDRAVPALQKAAASNDAKIKQRAEETLGRLRTVREVVPRLDEPATRREALDALKFHGFGGSGATAAVDPLRAALKDADRDNRYEAVARLGEIGPTAAKTLPDLARLYARSGDDDDLRVVIIEAAGDIGAATEPALDLIRRGLTDRSDEVRHMAANVIRTIGTRATTLAPALIDALPASSRTSREEMTEALRDLFDDEEHTPLLWQAIKHPDPYVRFAVAQLIRYEEGGADVAAPPLIVALRFPDAIDRATALRELEQMAVPKPPALTEDDHVAGLEALFPLIASRDDRERTSARNVVLALGPGGKASMPILLSSLASKNIATRIVAAKLIGMLGAEGAEAMPELQAHFDDAEEVVRLEALASWKAVASGPSREKAAADLIRLLDDRSSAIRASAAACLTDFVDATRVVAALTIHLDDADSYVADRIAATLATYPAARPYIALAQSHAGSEGLAAARAMLNSLDALDQTARRKTIRFLAKVRIDPEAAPDVRALLVNRDEIVRAQAAAILRRMGERGAQELIAALKDKDVHARQIAAFGLARVNAALPALIASRGDDDAEVRRAAAASIGSFDVAGAPARARLVALLADADRQVRLAAGFALRRVDALGLTSLESALTSGDSAIRRGAAETLGSLYRKADEAASALRAATGDTDPSVRAAASTALTKIARRVHEVGQTVPPRPRKRPAAHASDSGSVDALLVVDAKGIVEDAWIVRGDSHLNDAALAALAQWRYEPATIDGKPVAVIVPETIEVTAR